MLRRTGLTLALLLAAAVGYVAVSGSKDEASREPVAPGGGAGRRGRCAGHVRDRGSLPVAGPSEARRGARTACAAGSAPRAGPPSGRLWRARLQDPCVAPQGCHGHGFGAEGGAPPRGPGLHARCPGSSIEARREGGGSLGALHGLPSRRDHPTAHRLAGRLRRGPSALRHAGAHRRRPGTRAPQGPAGAPLLIVLRAYVITYERWR